MQMQVFRRVIALTEKTQGFTVDGKPLLALFSCEKQGKDYALTFTSSNLSRLTKGEYYVTVAGEREETLRFAPQTVSPLRARGELNAEHGLAVLVWTEQNGAPVPVAFGISGKVQNYKERMQGEIFRILHSPIYRQNNLESPNLAQLSLSQAPSKTAYEDEAIATENYYAVKENEDETNGSFSGENATTSGQNSQEKQGEKPRVYPKTDADACFGQEGLTSPLGEDFLGSFEKPSTAPFHENTENAFFHRKKSVIIQALTEGEKERALCSAVPGGYFAKLPRSPFVFGVITLRESLSAEDISTLTVDEVFTLCYALPTDSPSAETGKEHRYFLPVKTDSGKRGYLVTCQNPLTGNPEQISFA
ncbi:MAG: hypothetical protein IKC56_05420 [Clostridia bacterium]|nr:hypothetical protein [Clostridia bacterium]